MFSSDKLFQLNTLHSCKEMNYLFNLNRQDFTVEI